MSNNNLQRHESRDKSKWVVTFIAILLAFVAIAAAFVCIFSDGFTNWEKFKPEEEQTETPADEGQGNDMALVGGAVIGESVGSGVQLMSARIAPTEFAEYGISPMAETAYTLTATITPSNATNKSVDWSVAFVNPSSSWAKGKTVTDYVTVTPTSDGALTANVECKQAFGEQIKVVVTSRDNESATASCTVDYAKRVVSCSLSSSFCEEYSDGFRVVDSSSVLTYFTSDDLDFVYSDYTVDDPLLDSQIQLAVEGNSALESALSSGGVTGIEHYLSEYSTSTSVALNGSALFYFYVDYGFGSSDGSYYQLDAARSNKACEIAKGICADTPMYFILVKTSSQYGNEYSVKIPVYMSVNAFVNHVESVSLNQLNIIL